MLRELLRRLGIEIVARQPRNFPRLRRPALISEERITLVLDVGANTGQWAREVRDGGYTGRLVSFEPGAAAFAQLQSSGAGECLRMAAGESDGSGTLHVSENSVSSSLLPIGERQLTLEPRSAATVDETVEVRRLDSLDLVGPDDRVYLKADVEGGELAVLEGAAGFFDRVRLLELELSAYPLHEGQPLLGEVVAWCEQHGFLLIGFETSFRDRRTGDLLAGNGFFRRR